MLIDFKILHLLLERYIQTKVCNLISKMIIKANFVELIFKCYLVLYLPIFNFHRSHIKDHLCQMLKSKEYFITIKLIYTPFYKILTYIFINLSFAKYLLK